MKRFFLAISVLALFFSLLGETMAGSKPPTKICLDMNPSLNSFVAIVTKPMGSVTMADGATQFYAVHGVLISSPGLPHMECSYRRNGTYVQRWRCRLVPFLGDELHRFPLWLRHAEH